MPSGPGLLRDELLTQVSNKVSNQDFIAEIVFPPVKVAKDSAKIPVYGTEHIRLEETLRGNKSPARQATWSVSYTTYYLETHALKDLITQKDRELYDPPVDADVDTTEALTSRIQLRREVEAATVAFTTSTWSTNASLATTAAWAYNTTTVDPMINADSATSSVLLRSGKRPNMCVIGEDTYKYLRRHATILDRIKYTSLGQGTPGILASLFDVDRLVVGAAIRDAGVEGVSSSNTTIWGDKALFQYVESAPGLRKVSAGYMLTKNPGMPFESRRWYDEAYKGDFIEVETSFQFKAIATIAAYLYAGVDSV